jgi:Domain of unknown function (DUF4942)
METALVKKETTAALVRAHDKAVALAEQGTKAIKEAKQIMEATCGQYADICNCRDYDISAESCCKRIKNEFWKHFIKMMGVDALISVRKREELHKQLESDAAPEFTGANILAFYTQFTTDIDSYFEDSVKEVFDWLKPGSWTNYKTNEKSKYDIGRKVIKTYVFDTQYFSIQNMFFNHYGRGEQSIIALDKVFHLIEGKGIPRHPTDLLTIMRQAARDGETGVKTEYFKMKWFKNGNLHIEFLRLDLLRKLNAIAGKAMLKANQQAA